MSVLSYVHQLFNVDQCQAYIHTLRWKDRPLQCPRCQSDHIGRWGTYQYQNPPDLVVKFQPVGTVEVILCLALRSRVVYQQEIKG